jgi:hypothetical protein
MPTVFSCPATICACQSGSNDTLSIVRHSLHRNCTAGNVFSDPSSRARIDSTTTLATTWHFGHFPDICVSGSAHSARTLSQLAGSPQQRPDGGHAARSVAKVQAHPAVGDEDERPRDLAI